MLGRYAQSTVNVMQSFNVYVHSPVCSLSSLSGSSHFHWPCAGTPSSHLRLSPYHKRPVRSIWNISVSLSYIPRSVCHSQDTSHWFLILVKERIPHLGWLGHVSDVNVVDSAGVETGFIGLGTVCEVLLIWWEACKGKHRGSGVQNWFERKVRKTISQQNTAVTQPLTQVLYLYSYVNPDSILFSIINCCVPWSCFQCC